MDVQERLRKTIGNETLRLQAGIPRDREGALLEILRAQDRLTIPANHDAGMMTALRICFGASDDRQLEVGSEAGMGNWSEDFLASCDLVQEAAHVLAHCESGYMRLVEADDATFSAWVATKRTPEILRERADIDWWTGWLARQQASGAPASPSSDMYLKMMGHQLGYPPDAVIGGCSMRDYRAVLGGLIAMVLADRNHGEVVQPRSERDVIAKLAEVLSLDPEVVTTAMDAFTLDRENVAYHASVQGGAVAPLVRIAPDRVVLSRHGLTSKPLFFLARELRRRDPQEYHALAYLREDVFRQDLYALFPDKRFVKSPGRIELRRESGNIRTDIDAAIFDRKTGTLGIFELKSQDPYARSVAEMERRRDNVLYANRQISGALDWLNRHGGNDLLERVDRRTAKSFRVQKVFPFVLGRTLVLFNDGPTPDRRAAWATWPEVLRAFEDSRRSSGNPLASLFMRLNGASEAADLAHDVRREIVIGALRVNVFASYAAYREGA